MSSTFSAAPAPDDLVDDSTGEFQVAVACACGERYETATELLNCYNTHHE